MPLDKGMSHEDMVAELMRGYKKTGKIGATTPRDKKHALEIANAVAYNLEESKEIKKIEKEVTEMELSELLEALEEIVSAKEEELGIFEIEENPKVKVTLDSGETFETEVDPATSEDDLEKQYKIGTEINVGKEGQERKARIKSATLTKQMGEDYEEEYHTCEWCGEEFPESEMQYEKDMGWLCDTCIRAIESRGEELEFDESFDQQSYDMYVKDPSLYDLEMLQDLKQGFMDKRGSWTDEDIAELNAITKRMKELKATNEKFFNESKFIVYSPSEEREENLSPEDRSVFDSNGIRNIMISYLQGKTDKEVVRTFRTLIDKMPDEWVAEFLRNQDDTVVEPVNEDLENPPAVIENPTDVISLDIPLLMRLLEWSREQAGEDVDLHVLTENLVEAMKDTEFLTMDDYERLVPCEECSNGEKPIGESFSEDRADIEQTYSVDLSKNLKFNGLDEVPNEWLEFIEDSNYTFNNVQDLFKQQGYIIERVNEPAIETNYITFKVFKDQMGAKPTGVMEVTRVDLLKNNAYDIAYKIQRELEDRYPSILECDGSCATTSSDMGADQVLPFGKKNKVKKLKNKKYNRTVK